MVITIIFFKGNLLWLIVRRTAISFATASRQVIFLLLFNYSHWIDNKTSIFKDAVMCCYCLIFSCPWSLRICLGMGLLFFGHDVVWHWPQVEKLNPKGWQIKGQVASPNDEMLYSHHTPRFFSVTLLDFNTNIATESCLHACDSVLLHCSFLLLRGHSPRAPFHGKSQQIWSGFGMRSADLLSEPAARLATQGMGHLQIWALRLAWYL